MANASFFLAARVMAQLDGGNKSGLLKKPDFWTKDNDFKSCEGF